MNNLTEILEKAENYIHQLPTAPAPLPVPQGKDIAAWIDHTLLKPEATAEQVKQLCLEAKQYQFATVCVNPVYVSLVYGLLKGNHVGVCTVIGFPLGANAASMKAIEALHSLEMGASEIDMVMNIGALKGKAYGQVLNDIWAVKEVLHHENAILKVILETALLTREEKIIACLLAESGGADYVKTSTGFGPAGATVEDVDLMYRVVGKTMKVKAAGGIRSYQDALAMMRAGASRIGTSAGIKIVNEAIHAEEVP
ncbi:MAG: deoxyribose-phosphate aldolase [Anaerolineales bacterium]